MQRHQQVRADLVRAVRPFDVVRGLVRAVQEVGLQTGGQQPGLQPGGEIGDEIALAQVADGDSRVVPAVAGVDRDHDTEQRRAPLEQPHRLPQHVRAATDDGALELLQLPQRQRPAPAVGLQRAVVLEVPERRLGPRAEDAVRPSHVEPHVRQPFLQRRHVIPDEGVVDAVEEQPVAQFATGLLQGAEGVRADDAVRGQSPALLERPDGPVQGGVELQGGIEFAGGVEAGCRRHRRVGCPRPCAASWSAVRQPGAWRGGRVRQIRPARPRPAGRGGFLLVRRGRQERQGDQRGAYLGDRGVAVAETQEFDPAVTTRTCSRTGHGDTG